jgi:hypothetical protein
MIPKRRIDFPPLFVPQVTPARYPVGLSSFQPPQELPSLLRMASDLHTLEVGDATEIDVRAGLALWAVLEVGVAKVPQLEALGAVLLVVDALTVSAGIEGGGHRRVRCHNDGDGSSRDDGGGGGHGGHGGEKGSDEHLDRGM